jgi:hypothetical protein
VGIIDEMARRSRSRLRVDLAPGQTEGFIRYEYRGNNVDDYDRRNTGYYAFAVDGVMTDKYDGQVRLLDDDPAPRVRVRTPRRVAEGDTLQVRLELSSPTGYEMYVGGRVVRGVGPGARLSVGDIPTRWLERHFVATDDPRQPLHKAGVFLFERLRAGERTATLTIPIRADGVREGRERITLKIDSGRGRVTRTIRVVD